MPIASIEGTFEAFPFPPFLPSFLPSSLPPTQTSLPSFSFLFPWPQHAMVRCELSVPQAGTEPGPQQRKHQVLTTRELPEDFPSSTIKFIHSSVCLWVSVIRQVTVVDSCCSKLRLLLVLIWWAFIYFPSLTELYKLISKSLCMSGNVTKHEWYQNYYNLP